MAFQVFLVPSLNPSEQASIWQLQTLAQAYGLTLKTARRTRHALLSAVDAAEINRSDAVVVIVTRPLGDRAVAEIKAATKVRKPLYFLVEKSLTTTVSRLVRHPNIVPFDREEGIEGVAKQIRRAVQKDKTSKEMQTTLGWLLGIGAALFVLGSLASTEN